MDRDPPLPQSLVLATDIDVLPPDRELWREGDHLVVRSPGNPGHWWGNFLVFDGPPAPGDHERWEAAFDAAFADRLDTRHRALTWDGTDGAEGAARSEFADRGYRLERNVGLVASPAQLRSPRPDPGVEIRALDPLGDEALWEAQVQLELADHDPAVETPALFERFVRARQRERRELFAAGRGDWYVALAAGEPVAGCGVVATADRGRYQAVICAEPFRRRGIASRLVTEAGRDAAARHGLATLLIVADAEYHALGLYESLGFRAAERSCSVDRAQREPAPAVEAR